MVGEERPQVNVHRYNSKEGILEDIRSGFPHSHTGPSGRTYLPATFRFPTSNVFSPSIGTLGYECSEFPLGTSGPRKRRSGPCRHPSMSYTLNNPKLLSCRGRIRWHSSRPSWLPITLRKPGSSTQANRTEFPQQLDK